MPADLSHYGNKKSFWISTWRCSDAKGATATTSASVIHLTANPFTSEATLLSSWSQAGETAFGEVNLTLTQKGSHNFLS